MKWLKGMLFVYTMSGSSIFSEMGNVLKKKKTLKYFT